MGIHSLHFHRQLKKPRQGTQDGESQGSHREEPVLLKPTLAVKGRVLYQMVFLILPPTPMAWALQEAKEHTEGEVNSHLSHSQPLSPGRDA